MKLEDLEKRRDEIIGFNNDIATQLDNLKIEATKTQNEFNEKVKLFNENYAKLVEQHRVNLGALSEVQNWIEAIKKNEPETKEKEKRA